MAAICEAARRANVTAPELLYLLSLTEPALLTPDMVARAVAWRPATTSYPAAPPLERPADETWILLEEWRLTWTAPADPDALVALAWIYGAGTTETAEFWADAHPAELVQSRNEITEGAASAAERLGLSALTAEGVAELIDQQLAGAPTGGPWSEALPAAREALLGGDPPAALRLLLDASVTEEERPARAAELAELARRLGLLDLAETLVGHAGDAPRRAVVAARISLNQGAGAGPIPSDADLALRLVEALDRPLVEADRQLVALREGPGAWTVSDQWLYASAAAWLTRRGLAADAWARARRDAGRWKTDDPCLASLWVRMAKRRRPTPEDLRDWMDRCPL